MQIYVVRRGDTMSSISRKFGVSPAIIASDNQLKNPNRLVPGQSLMIATEAASYTVRPGDTLFKIAQRLGVMTEVLLAHNPWITDRNMLIPGQMLVIPGGCPHCGLVSASGYCYPFITEETLDATLPYLTYLNIFSYTFTPDGTLDTIRADWIIAQAIASGTAPVMVVSNIGDTGGFETELASAVLRDEAAQSALISAIEREVRERGYAGVDVDFEYVAAADRDLYSAFLSRLADVMHAGGNIISSAIPAKQSDDMTGLLFEGIDYRAIGQAVDMVLLMTYDWGYKTSPPQAVAPLNMVDKTLAYAVTRIPRDKILMGIPNYGYDWPLPFDASNPARTIMNDVAINLAVSNWSEISFDETAATPFFRYTSAGVRHVVWFEDARSINAKLELIEKYRILGYGIWNINNLFNVNLLIPSSMFTIR